MKKSIKKKWEIYWVGKEAKVTINKKRMIKILNRYSNRKRVLDAGCGTGFFSKYFTRRNCKTISLDYSKEALKLTRRLDSRIRTIRGDVFKLPFKNGTFDLIFSDGLLEHYKNPRDILLEFKRLLRPKGIIATFVPNKFSYWLLAKPFILKNIEEYRFTLNKLVELHESIEFKTIECGGFSVFPLGISPEFLGKYLGRIIYIIAEKGRK